MKKIVLVEDNEINSKLIRDFLQFKGYHVIVVTSGLDVKQIVQKELPKLILMDIQLFGMSGIDAAMQIKRDETLNNIPIVAVSAFSKEKLSEYNLLSLFVDYLEKPLDFSQFSAVVEKYAV